MYDVNSEMEADGQVGEKYNNDEKERMKCVQVCSTFLDGDWNKIKSHHHDVVITRIEEGVSNRLFIVELLKGSQAAESRVTSDVRKVVIRFYGSSFIPNDILTSSKSKNEMTESRLVSALSQLNLCPKLLATFPGGRIEPFVEGRIVALQELNENTEMNLQIARKIALIHSLSQKKELFAEIGIDSSRVLFTTDILNSYVDDFMKVKSELLECAPNGDSKVLLNYDFESEKEFLIESFKKLKSRIVFSHNDLHHKNIYIANCDVNNNDDLEQNLMFMDYEYANFNYRWADLAIYFTEIQFQSFDGENVASPVSEEFKARFIRLYLDEWSRLTETVLTDLDSIENVMNEVNVGTSILHFVRVLFFLSYIRKDAESKFHTWKYTVERHKAYLESRKLIKFH